MKSYFQRFQDLCIGILAQSDNCLESQALFRSARTVPELVTAWQRFWAGVMHEVPEQVIAAFADLYPVYRDDINRAGVFYNEAPPAEFNHGMVLVGDAPAADAAAITISGRHRVYVLGDAPITVGGSSSVHVNAARANVTLSDCARANIEQGTLVARGRSIVNGRGDMTCFDAATIYISGGTLTDHGHLNIVAFNDAVVRSFTNRRIQLNDQSKLIINE